MYIKQQREWHNTYRNQVCKALGLTVSQYNWLRRKGEALRKVYENDCNGLYQSEDERDNAERDIVYQINVYKQECTELLYAFFQTDPRGASLYLSTTEMTDSNYTNGYCIY